MRADWPLGTAMMCLALWVLPVRAQQLDVAEDSVQFRLVDTDLSAAVQALGRLLPKPVITAGIQDRRVEFFETPAPVPRAQVPVLLRRLVEAHGLEFYEHEDSYEVRAPQVRMDGRNPASFATAAPSDGSTTLRLFTVRLRHARARDVAATLNQLYGSGIDLSRPAGLSQGRLSDALRGDQESAAPADVVEGATLRSLVTIVPDELTNSLLIRATEGDFSVLQEGIQELDVRPLQVLIEVVVVEARRDRQFFLGFDINVPPYELPDGTLAGDLFGGGLGDLVVRVMQLGRANVNAVLAAARSRGDAEILSRPVILASNNTEASLLVGTQQPFVQMSRSLPTDTPQRDQVVQYRDVGTKLTVLPTINQDGYVSLLIQQEISSATGEVQFSAPVISSREATTRVLVADGQTIVIGGLRDQIRDQVRTGIPILADIPLIGGLFGSTRTRTIETELFLFITPAIIASDADGAAITAPRLPTGLEFRLRPESTPPVPTSPPSDSVPGGPVGVNQ